MKRVYLKWPQIIVAALLFLSGSTIIFRGQEGPVLPAPTLTVSPVPTAPTASPSEGPGVAGFQEALVVKVIDGDTVELEGGEKVRYIGVDTPETVDPRRKVGCFGKQASDENKKLVEGKKVWLERDVSDRDRYGRLLRYVYLRQENGGTLMVNEYLVRQGFARSSSYPPDLKYQLKFKQSEEEARTDARGLWKDCQMP